MSRISKASEPDVIMYRLIKICWNSYANVLINSWNYGTYKGELAHSHRESVICLRRVKASKAITQRTSQFLCASLNPHQTAYI